MEDISGAETKIRAYEAPRITVPSPDHVAYLDGQGTTPASILLPDLSIAGIKGIPIVEGRPAGAPYLAVYADGTVALYSVTDAIGGQTSMYLGAFATLPIVDLSLIHISEPTRRS